MRAVSLLVVAGLIAGACTTGDRVAGVVSTTTAAPTTTELPAITTVPPPPPTTTAPPPSTTTSTSTTTTTEPPAELLGVELELIAEIDHPLFITAPVGDRRIFVAQREGTVEVIDAAGQVLAEPFLDITDRVRANGIEQGLLGLAFHPDYDANGRFFVYYTDSNDDTTLVEFSVSDDPAFADPESARELLFIDQPTERHNAGMLEFGPDGYLYVAIGDGGDGGHNGQKPETLFGTILKLDVDSGDPYAVPADNPFVDGGGAPEVWAFGLRNPWRFSIDHETGLMYIGDVGQQAWEEIDVIPLAESGANLGWAFREGDHCFSSPECDEIESVSPAVEYSHSDGCSVTGGYVYRGDEIPELVGHYFYSDWCQGWVHSFRYDGTEAVDLQDWPDLDPGQVNTFGTDGFGELYLGTWSGEVWKLVPIRAGS